MGIGRERHVYRIFTLCWLSCPPMMFPTIGKDCGGRSAQEGAMLTPNAAPRDTARALVTLGTVVFVASVLGLASAHAFSVSFWPANAVLVGSLLRDRRLNCRAGWTGAFIGFVAADLMFGRTLSLATFFASVNLIGSMTAVAVLGRLGEADLALRRAHSVPRLVACLIPGCFAAALGGALLVSVEFGGSPVQALLTWPASELVNYLVVLPAMLTFRSGEVLAKDAAGREPGRTDTHLSPWPVLLLTLSCLAAVYFDGPGSIMFPMPALLLCALTYPVPLMALLTFMLGTGTLTALGLGIVDIGQNMSVPSMVVSVRIAVAFLVLVPLTIGSVMAVRDDLLDQLRHAAEHDGLTGLLNRRTFEQRLRAHVAAPKGSGRGQVILWLDIDHFKAVNDRHGHLAGDAVLKAFAAIARDCCRENDLIGRIGGEEFALLANVSGADEAFALADRLRQSFAAERTHWDGAAIRATVSIGAAFLDHPSPDVSDLTRRLDEALYRAKNTGRDRVEWTSVSSEPQSGSVLKRAAMRFAA